MMSSIHDLRGRWQAGQKVFITTHFNPDADALGSALATQQYLEKKGLETQVVLPSAASSNLAWMPGAHRALDAENKAHQAAIQQALEAADWIFCLDFSGIQRLQSLAAPLAQATAPKIVIDHHLNPEDFAQYYLHDIRAAATCELIYDWILHSGDGDLLDLDLATCIYAGMMTDTGSFRHPNTTAHVHEVAADLIRRGLDTNAIHRRIFDDTSQRQLQFLGHVLCHRLEYFSAYRLALITLSAEDLQQFDSQAGDTEGFVNYGLQISGAIWSIFMVERTDGVKFSFRSIEPFAVNGFAAQHFNGGGHKNAAGGKLPATNLEQARKYLMEMLPLQIDSINSLIQNLN